MPNLFGQVKSNAEVCLKHLKIFNMVFYPPLMMSISTSLTGKVLLLSFNLFDTISFLESSWLNSQSEVLRERLETTWNMLLNIMITDKIFWNSIVDWFGRLIRHIIAISKFVSKVELCQIYIWIAHRKFKAVGSQFYLAHMQLRSNFIDVNLVISYHRCTGCRGLRAIIFKIVLCLGSRGIWETVVLI